MNKISLFQLVFLTVGAMIGSAIFSLSGVTIASVDGSAVLSWALAGLVLFGFGLVTTNLTSVPDFEGSSVKLYDFPARAFKSNFLSYLTSWIYLFGCIAGVSFSATYFAHYLVAVLPVLLPVVHILPPVSVLLAFIVNCLKIKQFSAFNMILTILLIAILLVFAVVLYFHNGGSSRSVNVFPTSSANLVEMLSEVPVAMLAYGAIVVPAFMVPNVKNCKRNVRLGMLIAMILTTTIYCLVIFGTLRFVNAQYLIQHHEAVFAPLTAAIKIAKLPATFALATNIAAVLALFTTMLVVGRLGVSSVDNIVQAQNVRAQNSTEKCGRILFFAVVLITTLFYAKVQLIIDSGALFNALFTLIICASGFQLAKMWWHKILALLTAVVVFITYIPTLQNSSVALWITTVLYIALGCAVYKILKFLRPH